MAGERTPWCAVDALLAFVLEREPATRADWPELARRLDALAQARWSCPPPDCGRGGDDDDDAQSPTDADLRIVLGARFPEFGFYHQVAPLRADGELEFTEQPSLGDAIDDLSDIVHDLRAATRVRERRGAASGAAHLAWSFDIHWGQHLRDLQRYLHFLLSQADRIDPRQ
jgi:hypothetical protein